MNNFIEKMSRGLVFIGMSGSGKSTIGKMLAPKVGYGFIDSDHLIEEKYGKPLQTIVDSYDDKRDFLKMEDGIIRSIVLEKTILATGGSTCYSGQSIRELGGVIVFLQISWDTLSSRFKSFDERGVIVLHKTVYEEYLARQDMYGELSDLSIQCDGKGKTTIVNEVCGHLGFDV